MKDDTKNKTYEVNIFGWGREIVIGIIEPKTYLYFKKNKIDIAEWVSDWENSGRIPEDIQPFAAGQWTECDNILHAHGVDIDGEASIEIKNEKGDVIWSNDLDMDELHELGCNFKIEALVDFNDIKAGSYIYSGNSYEKGTFFQGNFVVEKNFDPSKLCFHLAVAHINSVCIGTSYEGIPIQKEDDSTRTNGSEFRFF